MRYPMLSTLLIGLVLVSQPGSAVLAQPVAIGQIEVNNNYRGEVQIRLYHADALDRIFKSWTLLPSRQVTLFHDGQPLVLGGDWLIDIRFGNGVTSSRRLVHKVGVHDGVRWIIQASDIYNER